MAVNAHFQQIAFHEFEDGLSVTYEYKYKYDNHKGYSSNSEDNGILEVQGQNFTINWNFMADTYVRGSYAFLAVQLKSCNNRHYTTTTDDGEVVIQSESSLRIRLYSHIRKYERSGLGPTHCLLADPAMVKTGDWYIMCTKLQAKYMGLDGYRNTETPIPLQITMNVKIMPRVHLIEDSLLTRTSLDGTNRPNTSVAQTTDVITKSSAGVKSMIFRKDWMDGTDIKLHSLEENELPLFHNVKDSFIFTTFGDQMETMTWKLLFWRKTALVADEQFLSLYLMETNFPYSSSIGVIYHMSLFKGDRSESDTTRKPEWKLCLEPHEKKYKFMKVGDYLDLCTREKMSNVFQGTEKEYWTRVHIEFLLDIRFECHRGTEGTRDLISDMSVLLSDPSHADVVFLVEGNEIVAHKCILAARSEVFRAMFASEMREKQENRVVINDIRADVFQQLLTYVYTGNVHNIDSNARELFQAADKYGLLKLRDICEQVICSTVCSETAVSDLQYLILHKTDNLKRLTVEKLLDILKEKM